MAPAQGVPNDEFGARSSLRCTESGHSAHVKSTIAPAPERFPQEAEVDRLDICGCVDPILRPPRGRPPPQRLQSQLVASSPCHCHRRSYGQLIKRHHGEWSELQAPAILDQDGSRNHFMMKDILPLDAGFRKPGTSRASCETPRQAKKYWSLEGRPRHHANQGTCCRWEQLPEVATRGSFQWNLLDGGILAPPKRPGQLGSLSDLNGLTVARMGHNSIERTRGHSMLCEDLWAQPKPNNRENDHIPEGSKTIGTRSNRVSGSAATEDPGQGALEPDIVDKMKHVSDDYQRFDVDRCCAMVGGPFDLDRSATTVKATTGSEREKTPTIAHNLVGRKWGAKAAH